MYNMNQLIAYEEGLLTEEETTQMFQEMIDDGSVWNLADNHVKTANDLIKKGLCSFSDNDQYLDDTDPSEMIALHEFGYL